MRCRGTGGATGAFEQTHKQMPKFTAPDLSTAQVGSVAAKVLPGSQVRRLVYWRYLLRWQRPGA